MRSVAVLVRPDIDAEHAATGCAAAMRGSAAVQPAIVEAHAVDHRAVLGQAEQPRPRIARLRPRRQRADFHRAEAEPEKARRSRAPSLSTPAASPSGLAKVAARRPASPGADRRMPGRSGAPAAAPGAEQMRCVRRCARSASKRETARGGAGRSTSRRLMASGADRPSKPSAIYRTSNEIATSIVGTRRIHPIQRAANSCYH